MKQTENLCESLKWDTDFFGFKVARITRKAVNSSDMEQILHWAHRNSIRVLYFAVGTAEMQTIRLAEANSFRLVDVRITLDQNLDQNTHALTEDQKEVRICQAEDIPLLRAIARESHHDTRFYQDPNFPRELCDLLYETWIEKSCKGYADAVLVAETGNGLAGYLSCHLLGDGQGKIGLMAIAKRSQGMGVGTKIVRGCLAWFSSRGVRRVSVVTQGRNYQAQRLYQKLGFRTAAIDLWYHKWL